jgi:cytoskeleton protein RodZ
VGTFGERLQREREMRGITLQEIAEATKIGTRSLRALEQEQFDKLPGGIFNKGFVRAYARYLGIDEEQAVADYLAAAKASEEPAEPKHEEVEAASAETPISTGTPWLAFAVIVVVAVVAAGGWYLYNRRKAQPGAPPPPAQETSVPAAPAALPSSSVPAAPSPTPAVTPATAAPTSAPAASDKKAAAVPTELAAGASVSSETSPITLRIRARADSWMRITADDKLVMSEILGASQEKVVRADRTIVLDIGNAGGVEITQNGKPLPPLGPEGKRRVVTFTPEGIRE